MTNEATKTETAAQLGGRVEPVVSTELRVILVNNRDFIKDLLPTTKQVKLIHLAKARGRITSADVSRNFEISIQNATQQLKNLYDKGYFGRDDEGDPTGGCLYEYYCNAEY